MNLKPDTTGSAPEPSGRTPTLGQTDLASMDRDALLVLSESFFRWALRHTGLTRQQILAQIARDDASR